MPLLMTSGGVIIKFFIVLLVAILCGLKLFALFGSLQDFLKYTVLYGLCSIICAFVTLSMLVFQYLCLGHCAYLNLYVLNIILCVDVRYSLLHRVSEKAVQNSFYQNFVNFLFNNLLVGR